MSVDGWIGRGIPETLTDEAASWIARLDAETVSDEDRAAFFDWLASSADHRWAYEEQSSVWAKMSLLHDVHEQLDRSHVIGFPREPVCPPVTRWQFKSGWQHACAALLVMLSLASGAFDRGPTTPAVPEASVPVLAFSGQTSAMDSWVGAWVHGD